MKRRRLSTSLFGAVVQTLERRTLLSSAYLVKDINTGTLDSHPFYLTPFDNALYFVAYNGTEGGLMRYDGANAGIQFVEKIPGSMLTPLVVANGDLYFGTSDSTNGSTLWKTDGTAAGTEAVKTMLGPVSELTAGGNKVFFVSQSDFWASDGTPAGTVILSRYPAVPIDRIVPFGNKVLFPGGGYRLLSSDGTVGGTQGIGDISVVPGSLTVVGNSAYFLSTGTNTNGLWRSDGTTAGTKLVAHVNVPTTGDTITASGPNIYFAASDPLHGLELWKSDGTAAGTAMVKDINAGKADSAPTDMIDLNGSLLFAATDAAGQALVRTDGSEAGTVLVQRIKLAGNDPVAPTELVQNNELFFTADDGVHGWQPWKSDGTTAGTGMIDMISPYLSSFPYAFTAFAGKVYFSADDGIHGRELWSTDGTAAGTQLVQDLNTTPASGRPFQMTALNGGIIFDAVDAHGAEPWVSDGTAAGTHLLKDIAPLTSSLPVNFTNVNGTVYFAASDGTSFGLWKTDGTSQGTVQVPIPDVNQVHAVHKQFNVDGTLFFDTSDAKLWKTDGTPAGTVAVSSIPAPIDEAVAVGNKLFFASGGQLLITDGTSKGTGELMSNSNSVNDLVVINGVVYFSAEDYRERIGIWRSDGTYPGTVLVKTLSYQLPTGLANLDGSLYFFAWDPNTRGIALWKSDGSDAGTALIKSFGLNASVPTSVAVAGGLLYFTESDPTHGTELWESDGTEAGTHLVSDINPGAASSNPDWLTPVGNLLYFSADDGVHGQELWRTDGTPAGTVMVQDINPGSAASKPASLSLIGGKLYFSADDGSHGRELWALDVTGGISGSVVGGPGRGNRSRGVAGLTVYLDANHNGILDPGEISTTTDAQGRYLFSGLLPGTYTVTLAPSAANSEPIVMGDTIVRPGEVSNGPVFLIRRLPHGRRPHDLPLLLGQRL